MNYVIKNLCFTFEIIGTRRKRSFVQLHSYFSVSMLRPHSNHILDLGLRERINNKLGHIFQIFTNSPFNMSGLQSLNVLNRYNWASAEHSSRWVFLE